MLYNDTLVAVVCFSVSAGIEKEPVPPSLNTMIWFGGWPQLLAIRAPQAQEALLNTTTKNDNRLIFSVFIASLRESGTR
jgi:hypothetical protein